MQNFAEIASLYQRCAEAEAHGRSPLYEQLALEIAGDESTLELLSAFPRPKQQPNLLFAADRLAGKKIYYDRATVLRQLGVFRKPQSAWGQICILATHPATIARAYARKFLRM